MTHYVLGLLLTPGRGEVVVLQKDRPRWQEGLYNAPGGHVEQGERPVDALVREMREETGAEVDASWWQYLGTDSGNGPAGEYRLDWYTAEHPQARHARTLESETVERHHVEHVLHHRDSYVPMVPERLLQALCAQLPCVDREESEDSRWVA